MSSSSSTSGRSGSTLVFQNKSYQISKLREQYENETKNEEEMEELFEDFCIAVIDGKMGKKYKAKFPESWQRAAHGLTSPHDIRKYNHRSISNIERLCQERDSLYEKLEEEAKKSGKPQRRAKIEAQVSLQLALTQDRMEMEGRLFTPFFEAICFAEAPEIFDGDDIIDEERRLVWAQLHRFIKKEISPFADDDEEEELDQEEEEEAVEEYDEGEHDSRTSSQLGDEEEEDELESSEEDEDEDEDEDDDDEEEEDETKISKSFSKLTITKNPLDSISFPKEQQPFSLYLASYPEAAKYWKRFMEMSPDIYIKQYIGHGVSAQPSKSTKKKGNAANKTSSENKADDENDEYEDDKDEEDDEDNEDEEDDEDDDEDDDENDDYGEEEEETNENDDEDDDDDEEEEDDEEDDEEEEDDEDEEDDDEEDDEEDDENQQPTSKK